MDYLITIEDHLDEYGKSWFGDCEIMEKTDTTRIRFHPADQAALYGILQRIQNLRLSLVGVEREEE